MRCAVEGLELLDAAPLTREAAQDLPSPFPFKARVADLSSAAKVRFTATSDFGESDAVEVSLPILPPACFGTRRLRPLSPRRLPSVRRRAGFVDERRGDFDVTLSTSPWLPKLSGLPTILEYPHGCFEQISTRVLAYAHMTSLLATLPDSEAREAAYQAMLKTSFARYEAAVSATGMLPYWPEGSGISSRSAANPFSTTLAAWAVLDSPGLSSPELQAKFTLALDRIITGKEPGVEALTRCLALTVAGRPETAGTYGPVAQDLYLRRDSLPDEGRALLALAMQAMKVLPREQAQLLKEIAKLPAERAFNPRTFGSTTRAEAVTTLALARLAPEHPALKVRRERLLREMEGSAGFNTQENFWQLLAFKAIVESRAPVPLGAAGATLTSKDGASSAWTKNDLARLASFAVEGLPTATPLTALVTSEYRSTEAETSRTDRGLRLERVVRNLTDPKRLGTAEAPYKLGDQLLVTYRVISRNRQYYVALEDLLPAGLETVNSDLPLIAKSYHLPADQEGHPLFLSHSELRDQSSCLYFDELEEGVGKYSVLARATTAGTFHWPPRRSIPCTTAASPGFPQPVCAWWRSSYVAPEMFARLGRAGPFRPGRIACGLSGAAAGGAGSRHSVNPDPA